MSELEITITGPAGSGKTVLANWLHSRLGERATGTSGIRIIDDGPGMSLPNAEELLSGVLRNKNVTIRTVQVSRKARAARGEDAEIPPPRDCPGCDYSWDDHHRDCGTAPPGDADDCVYTQEDLR